MIKYEWLMSELSAHLCKLWSKYIMCLQTARLKINRGLLEVDVPLLLKGGPTVMLHMKACLLVPDLHLSSPTLAFGPVQTGKCKVRLSVLLAMRLVLYVSSP